MSKNSAVNAKIARPAASKRIERPTKTEKYFTNRDAVKEKSENNITVPTTSSKKLVTATTTKKISSSQNAVAKPQISSKSVVASKPKPTVGTSTIKPKIISTATNKANRQQPIRAIHQVVAKKPVAEKNVMNTIHNVTVASPPAVRKEHPNMEMMLHRQPEPVDNMPSLESLPRERTKTRTLGPEEALILKHAKSDHSPTTNSSQDNSAISSKIEQKPLKIQDPVAYEITFEKPVTSSTTDNSKPSDVSEEADYEDDFDSYESDFETESSSASQIASISSKSEDESASIIQTPSASPPVSPLAKKTDYDRDFDSGTYELKGSAEKVQLDSIDERELHSEGQTDSGFGYNNATPSPIDQIVSMSSSVFSKPSIKPAYNKRGMELMKKINLDTMTFTLFELKPLLYDLYMKIYGHKNTNQNSSQTMGNMIDQDVQTDGKAKQSMWTQYPPNCGANVASHDDCYHQNRIGCGEGLENATTGQSSDACRLENSLKIINRANVIRDVRSTKPVDYERLNFFLQKSAITISAICETSASTRSLHKSDSTFSDGFFCISIDNVEILNDSAVYYMYSNPTIENLVYVAHRQGSTTRTHDASLVSVWNLMDTKKPIHVLSCWSLIICLEVHLNFPDVVIGGLTDGCVAIWNCNESSYWHQINNERTLPPTHIVSPSLDTRPISFDFGCVISLKSVHPVNVNNDDGFKLTQICSLHEFGMVTVWTILNTTTLGTNLTTCNERKIDHRSPWSKIQLVQSSIIDLTSMHLNRKARPKSGFDKKKMYFESNLFNDAALRELHDFDARKDLSSDQSENFRCVDMEYHEDGIVIATNKSFLVFVATSLNRDSLRKVFIDESNLLHAIKLKSLDDILLVGLTDGSVKVLRVTPLNISRKSSDKESRTVTGSPFEQDNFNAKSCAIQNIIKEERKTFDDDAATDRFKKMENVIDGADMMRRNRLINNQVLLPAMSSNRDFVRWMDVSVNLNCLMTLCGEQLRIINFDSPVESRVAGDGCNVVAFATIVLGHNQREYLVNFEEDNVRVHLLRMKII